MITDAAMLLRKLMAAEVETIEKQGIKHAPTIGAMYEGLTRDILGRTLPESLGIQIAHGFIQGPSGELSTQIDCMLVSGSGRMLPHISDSVWNIEDVICVVEVKKNLFSRELNDSFLKQRQIHRLFVDYMSNSSAGVDLTPTFRSFAQLTGKYLSNYDDAEKLDILEKLIFHMMVTELVAPIRIIFGYEGYSHEHSLRERFLSYIEARIDEGRIEGLGAQSFPNLIVAGSAALVKMNGYPYIARLDDDSWHAIVSNSENPLRLIIEMIWAKIENKFGIKLPDDSNPKKERMAPLIRCKVKKIDVDKWGWIYEAVTLSANELMELRPVDWAPDVLESHELQVLSIAINDGYVDVNDGDLREFAMKNGLDSFSIVDRLVARRLLAWSGTSTARPIHDNLNYMFTPDGNIYVTANTNMVSEWLSRKIPFKGRSIGLAD